MEGAHPRHTVGGWYCDCRGTQFTIDVGVSSQTITGAGRLCSLTVVRIVSMNGCWVSKSQASFGKQTWVTHPSTMVTLPRVGSSWARPSWVPPGA